MKFKTIGAIACAVMIFVTVLNWPVFFVGQKTDRYQQHLDAPEKTPCADDAHDNTTLCTHLPIISIDTGGVEIPGKAIKEKNKTVGYTTAADGSDRILGTIDTFDSQTNYNHPTDTPTTESQMTIHVRGNSSRTFDKLGYRINLMDSNGKNNSQSLLGMDAHHEWALHGPILDKTLMRNYMWYNIAGEIMDYAPNVRFCELIINGEYMEVYVLEEIITAGDTEGSRLNVKASAKDNMFTGYVLLLDRLDDPDSIGHLNSFTTYTLRTNMNLEIVYPGKSNLTSEIYTGIKDDFSAFEKALYSYDYDNQDYGYETLIDVDSFIDYFLINEFTCNYDAGWLSTYMYKDINGKFQMCIWDFNSACDNYQQSMINSDRFEMQKCLWYFMLFKDEAFTQRCVDRYYELRKTYLSEEYLYNYIDEVAAYLGDAIDRNYEKWGYTFGPEHDLLKPEERNPRNYQESIDNMKAFIHDRGDWMDRNIESIKQYSAPSAVKKFNENAN